MSGGTGSCVELAELEVVEEEELLLDSWEDSDDDGGRWLEWDRGRVSILSVVEVNPDIDTGRLGFLEASSCSCCCWYCCCRRY